MTENQTPSYQRTMYGGLAGYFTGRKEDQKHVRGALEVLAGKDGVDLDEEQLGFMKGALSTKESTQNTGKIYARQYLQALGTQKVSDLAKFYAPILSGIDGKAVARIGKVLEKFGDETRRSIENAFGKAQYVLEDQFGVFSDEQKADAQETIKKYEPIMAVFATLDEYTFEGLRPKAVDRTRKSDLEALAKQI